MKYVVKKVENSASASGIVSSGTFVNATDYAGRMVNMLKGSSKQMGMIQVKKCWTKHYARPLTSSVLTCRPTKVYSGGRRAMTANVLYGNADAAIKSSMHTIIRIDTDYLGIHLMIR